MKRLRYSAWQTTEERSRFAAGAEIEKSIGLTV